MSKLNVFNKVCFFGKTFGRYQYALSYKKPMGKDTNQGSPCCLSLVGFVLKKQTLPNQGSKTIQNKQSLFSLLCILVYTYWYKPVLKALLVYTYWYKTRSVFPKQTYRDYYE